MAREGEGEEKRKPDVFGAWLAIYPLGEGDAAGVRDSERPAVASSTLAGLDQTGVSESAEFTVNLALRQRPEVADDMLRGRHEIPAGQRPVVEEPEQRGGGGVQRAITHRSTPGLTFHCVMSEARHDTV